MRLEQHGPDIPDELLLAADAGEVVFICGAGVSLSKAGLPDFKILVEKVCADLTLDPVRPAAKIIAAEEALAQSGLAIDLPQGVGGLVSPDRLFGYLEGEFGSLEVDQAIARALRPPEPCDLSAHQTLLRLATTQARGTRLVTTNFDRLFEDAADGDLEVFTQTNLQSDFDGLVKIHGTVDEGYSCAGPDGLVISTSGFGAAYVADGWASRFLRSLLERNTVVFVGYGADDPPMQYLLEALYRISPSGPRAYAFDVVGEGLGRWAGRGVHAIGYDPSNGHAALWSTLEAWSHRVADPAAWGEATTALALDGPRGLPPYQRGQIMHLVSSTEGAKAFVGQGNKRPPAEWICVFDTTVRCGRHSPEAPGSYDGDELSPYELYGIDTDPSPEPPDPNNPYAAWIVSDDAKHALNWTPADRSELTAAEINKVHGMRAANGIGQSVANLPPRLHTLLHWLRMVAHEPAAVWWGARQSSLHPSFARHLTQNLDRDRPRPCDAAQAWQIVLELLKEEEPRDEPAMVKARFEMHVRTHGWSVTTLREWERLTRPGLKRQHDHSAVPPPKEAGVSRRRMTSIDVDYREGAWDAVVPDQFLVRATSVLRKHLESAVQMEVDCRGWFFERLPPIVRSDDSAFSDFQYQHDLGGAFFAYLKKLNRLAEIEPAAFAAETRAWPEDPYVFDRLRIWLASQPNLASAEKAFSLLHGLGSEAFWRQYHERDLLHAIRDRWDDFATEQKQSLERKLLAGRQHRWGVETDAEYEKARAWASLSALGWLHSQGVRLEMDWPTERDRLKNAAPEWKDEYGEAAAASMGMRGGTVQKNTDHSELASVPIENLVEECAKRSGRSQDFLVENDPFLGIVQADPERAIEALEHSKADEEAIGAALSTLLWESRERHEQDLVRRAGHLVLHLGEPVFQAKCRDIAMWLDGVIRRDAGLLDVGTQNDILDRAIAILASDEADDLGEQDDWLFVSINSAAGIFANALLRSPDLRSQTNDEGLPSSWKDRADKMLAWPNQHAAHATVALAGGLPYLFAHDPDWARGQLLDRAAAEHPDQFFAGLLSYSHTFSAELFELVKPLLKQAVIAAGESLRNDQALAFQFLAAWMRADVNLTDPELTELLRQGPESLRLEALHFMERHLEGANEETGTRIVHFFQRVWPKQIDCRSVAVSHSLVRVIVAAGAILPDIKRAVEGLIIPGNDGFGLYFLHSDDEPIASHPEAVLDLVDRLLPAPLNERPYDLDDLLHRITKASPDLANDARYLRLSSV